MFSIIINSLIISAIRAGRHCFLKTGKRNNTLTKERFMKRMVVAVAVFVVFSAFRISAQTPGLKVTVTTVDPAGGGFGTSYEVVMWIETNVGAFVKTFALWGHQTNSNDLPWWSSKNNGDKTVDGTTSATLTASSTLNATWDLTGSSGAQVINGTYRYNIELNNHHNTINAYTGWFARGSIAIDGIGKTKNGVDTSTANASAALTNVIGAYSAPTISVQFTPPPAAKPVTDPLSFATPAGAGHVTMKLLTPGGRLLWQKDFTTADGRTVSVSRSEISSVRYTGVCLLVADFGTKQIVRSYVGIR